MIYTQLFFMLACGPLAGGQVPCDVKVFSNDVRLRNGPGTQHAVVEILNKGSVVKMLGFHGETTLVDAYYGRWCKIVSNSGKHGYVLSCFLDDVDDHERFHVFWKKFSATWAARYQNPSTSPRVQYENEYMSQSVFFPLKVSMYWGEHLEKPLVVMAGSLLEHDAYGKGTIAGLNRTLLSVKTKTAFFMRNTAICIELSPEAGLALAIVWHVVLREKKWIVKEIEYIDN